MVETTCWSSNQESELGRKVSYSSGYCWWCNTRDIFLANFGLLINRALFTHLSVVADHIHSTCTWAELCYLVTQLLIHTKVFFTFMPNFAHLNCSAVIGEEAERQKAHKAKELLRKTAHWTLLNFSCWKPRPAEEENLLPVDARLENVHTKLGFATSTNTSFLRPTLTWNYRDSLEGGKKLINKPQVISKNNNAVVRFFRETAWRDSHRQHHTQDRNDKTTFLWCCVSLSNKCLLFSFCRFPKIPCYWVQNCYIG